MEENNVHITDPNEREDLKHEDTVLGGGSIDGGDPAGYEQSINPVGEVPPPGNATDVDGSGASDDIPNEGDLVHPAPVNAPVGKMPGM